jgi:hypothetical protein
VTVDLAMVLNLVHGVFGVNLGLWRGEFDGIVEYKKEGHQRRWGKSS